MSKINFLGFMRRKNMSQIDLANKLGVTSATVSMYCNGKSGITFDKVDKLIELGITPAELFGEENGKKLLGNVSPDLSDEELEKRVLAVINRVGNRGTIQVGLSNA
jgi:transcriptional regulator with XRE-family HTH domain